MIAWKSLSHWIQKFCSLSKQQSANASIISLFTPIQSAMNRLMAFANGLGIHLSCRPVYIFELNIVFLEAFACMQLGEKRILTIQNPLITIVLTTIVLSLPLFVIQIVTSLISTCYFYYYYSSCFLYWLGVFTSESNLTRYYPIVFYSSIEASSQFISHPPLLNSFQYDAKLFRFSFSAFIYQAKIYYSGGAFCSFSALQKLNFCLLKSKADWGNKEIIGITVLVMIRLII